MSTEPLPDARAHDRLRHRASLADADADARAGGRGRLELPRSCRSTRRPTSPTSRCRSTPRRRATRRWKPSSASPSRSRPRSPGCRDWTTRARCRATGCRRSPWCSRTAPTSTSRASRWPSAAAGPLAELPAGVEPEWGRSPPAWARSSCTRSKPSRARKPDGRPGRRPTCAPAGLGHPPAAAQRAWRHRGQHHRRLRAPDPHHARFRRRLVAYRVHAAGRGRCGRRNNQNIGAGYIERNGQQYLVRVPGQVASSRSFATSCSIVATACRSACATWPRSVRVRSCAPAPPPRTARGGAGHGVHADRRKQPRSGAAPRRAPGEVASPAARRQGVNAGLRPHRAGRSHHRHGREEPGRRRAAGDRGAVPAARQFSRRADHGGRDSLSPC
jgi:hypothetical protein